MSNYHDHLSSDVRAMPCSHAQREEVKSIIDNYLINQFAAAKPSSDALTKTIELLNSIRKPVLKLVPVEKEFPHLIQQLATSPAEQCCTMTESEKASVIHTESSSDRENRCISPPIIAAQRFELLDLLRVEIDDYEDLPYFKLEPCADGKMKVVRVQQASVYRQICQPYACKSSEEQFPSHGRVKQQKWKPHKCQLCGRSFISKSLLIIHKQVQNFAKHAKPFICGICGFACETCYGLKSHEVKHASELQYTCKKWGEKFVTLSHPLFHKKRCGKRTYSCKHCSQKFDHQFQTVYHMHENWGIGVHKVDHHADINSDPLKCTVCLKQFTSKLELTSHMQFYQKVEPVLCGLCQRYFLRQEFRSHIKSHERKRSCKPHENIDKKEVLQRKRLYVVQRKSLCSKDFSDQAKHSQHKKVKHSQHDSTCVDSGSTRIERLEQEPALKKYKCLQCEERFHNANEVLKHEQEHVERKHSCVMCGGGFRTMGFMQKHVKIHRGVDGLYNCDVCEKSFRLYSGLASHKMRHSRKDTDEHLPLKCSVCGARFLRSKGLYHHRKMNHPEVECYSCGICGAAFNTSRKLSDHKLKEKHRRGHPCEHCGKLYMSKHQLLSHKMKNVCRPQQGCTSTESHASRDWKCAHCGKQFQFEYKLQSHMRRHDPSKLLVKCDICLKTYYGNWSLKAHKLSCHQCEYCGKDFAYKSRLASHKRQVCERPLNYKCTTCGALFGSAYKLQCHQKLHDEHAPQK